MAARIAETVKRLPFYGERFKNAEVRRFTPVYLEALSATDPWHVALADYEGRPAGFCVTVPEYGTLWTAWIATFQEFDGTAIGMTMIRDLIRHWDNDRFHKTACFVKPENRGALTIFRRVGFVEKARLASHIYGEDVLLLERPFTKAIAGYDDGVDVSRFARWRRSVRRALGRAT